MWSGENPSMLSYFTLKLSKSQHCSILNYFYPDRWIKFVCVCMWYVICLCLLIAMYKCLLYMHVRLHKHVHMFIDLRIVDEMKWMCRIYMK